MKLPTLIEHEAKLTAVSVLLNPNGKVTVAGITLAEEGFNFHYFTNIYKTQKGSQYYFCYDQGYIRTVNDQYMLVKKQDYVK